MSIVFNAGRDVDFSLRLLAHDTWEKLLAFIAQYRLEELELVYPINDVALKLPDHVWLSIERLHLEAHDDRPFARQHLFSNFGKLSSLRHLKISGSRNLDGIDRILPWQQMQTLEVRGQGCVTPSWWLCVLRQCRLLERCCITLSKESFTSPVISEEEKIVLANMDYFHAEFGHGLWVSLFLQPLVIPNVTTFSLWPAFMTCLIIEMPVLIGIIQRSEGMRHIRRLVIGHTLDVLDVGVLLELLPSLESISIENGHLSDNSIKQLSSGKLGPRLCNIYLNDLHDADQILSMVESRYQNATLPPDSEHTPCPFKSISIPCAEPTLQKSVYRIKLLSEKCHANISLDVKVRADW